MRSCHHGGVGGSPTHRPWGGTLVWTLASYSLLLSLAVEAFLPPAPSSTWPRQPPPISLSPGARRGLAACPVPSRGFSRDLVVAHGAFVRSSRKSGNHSVVVFMRHGQTFFNKEEIFSGWCDVDLNTVGLEECRRAGMLLASHGFEFDVAYTSVLKRATKSLWAMLDGNDNTYIPIINHWKLNERHYGALQGLSKLESERRLGPIVKEWRRSWNTPPPMMDETHSHWRIIMEDRRYRDVPNIPRGESLEMCSVRVKEYWDEEIVPTVRSGKRVVVVAHANSLRSLIKKDIELMAIPNGKPLVYHFDADMNVVGEPDEIGFRGRYLSDKRLSRYEEQVKRSQQLFAEDPYREPEEYVIDFEQESEAVLFETGHQSKKSEKKEPVKA